MKAELTLLGGLLTILGSVVACSAGPAPGSHPAGNTGNPENGVNTPNLDVSVWYKWQDALKGSGDLTLESAYWKTSGARNDTYCADLTPPQAKGCNITGPTMLYRQTM